MTGIWTLMAAVCAAEAMWLKQWRPVRVPADLAPAGRVRELPLPLVLEMLSVAIRQGSSIPRALIAVGDIAAGDFGAGLRSAGEQLNRGIPWNDAWPDDGDLAVVRDAFASSWHSGASPVERLETAVEQLDWDERSQIEQAAAKLRFVCCCRLDCAFFLRLLRWGLFRPLCRLWDDGRKATWEIWLGKCGKRTILEERCFVDKCG